MALSQVQQRQHPPFVQVSSHLVAGMMAVEDGEPQRVDGSPSRDDLFGMRGIMASTSSVMSSFRKTPKTKGRWATGATRSRATAMMELFRMMSKGRPSSSWSR